MKFLKEVLLPAGLWLYFLVEGVRGGLGIAARDMQAKQDLPPGFAPVLTGVLFLLGAGLSLLDFRIEKRLFKGFLVKVLGEESYHVAGRRLKPHLLGASFLAVMGTAGLVKTGQTGAPMINQAVLQALLGMGFGMLAGWAVLAAAKRSPGGYR